MALKIYLGMSLIQLLGRCGCQYACNDIGNGQPQLYDLLTNGMYQGKLDFNCLKTSCEEMSKVLADHTLGGKWGQAADFRRAISKLPRHNLMRSKPKRPRR